MRKARAALRTHAGTITASGDHNDRTIGVTLHVAIVGSELDGDGDVDQEDFDHLQVCGTGAGVAVNDPDCGDADLDNDGDVDNNDSGTFQGCLSGANLPADKSCVPK